MAVRRRYVLGLLSSLRLPIYPHTAAPAKPFSKEPVRPVIAGRRRIAPLANSVNHSNQRNHGADNPVPEAEFAFEDEAESPPAGRIPHPAGAA